MGLAADLQFSAAIPPRRYVEYLTPCAYIDELTTEPFQIDSAGKPQHPVPARIGCGY